MLDTGQRGVSIYEKSKRRRNHKMMLRDSVVPLRVNYLSNFSVCKIYSRICQSLIPLISRRSGVIFFMQLIHVTCNIHKALLNTLHAIE